MALFIATVSVICGWFLYFELRKTQKDVEYWRHRYHKLERDYWYNQTWVRNDLNPTYALTSTVVRAPYDSPTNVPAYVSVDPGTYYEQENPVSASEKSTTLPS